MKAVYITEFGESDKLEIRDVPSPSAPGGSEVIVRVHYAGLNRADLLQRRGLYPPPSGYDARIPGLEFAGVVEEVGDTVADLKKGDEVFGITAGEAQAEFVRVDRRLVAKITQIGMESAAAVPEAYVTAHDALITQAGLQAGETVLIHAIASGVGLAAAQIAKEAEATVIGTSRSPDKLERLMNEAGSVDHTIETSGGPVFAERVIELTDGRGVDVVLDLVGGAYFPENLKSMASKGRIMLVGLTAGRNAEFDMGIALTKRLTIKGTVLRSRSNDEKAHAMQAFSRDILPGVGSIYVPVVDRVFDVNDVAAAHEYLASNESFGKVILRF